MSGRHHSNVQKNAVPKRTEQARYASKPLDMGKDIQKETDIIAEADILVREISRN